MSCSNRKKINNNKLIKSILLRELYFESSLIQDINFNSSSLHEFSYESRLMQVSNDNTFDHQDISYDSRLDHDVNIQQPSLMRIITMRSYINEKWILISVAGQKSASVFNYWNIKDYGLLHESLVVDSIAQTLLS